MSTDEILARLHRIYAAVSVTVEGDLSKFPPKVVSNERGFAVYQDFLGGLNAAQVSNLAHSVIHNIANFEYHLRRWAANNGHDPKAVDHVLGKSTPLQLVKDLSNNDKHGYPPRNSGCSGKTPKLKDVGRVLRLTTGTESGSGIMVYFTPQGPKQVVSGGGGSAVVITGEIVDGSGSRLGNLHDIEVEALKAWEQELHNLGLLR